jgi:putative FmdB family regulatory protein
MPTYEYACSSCQHEWEAEQSIKENALTECPVCHNQTAKRQISRGGGFILKGGGWYSDLYSSPSNKAEGVKTESKASDASATAKSASEGASGSSGSSGSSSSGSSGGSSSGDAGGSSPSPSKGSAAAA